MSIVINPLSLGDREKELLCKLIGILNTQFIAKGNYSNILPVEIELTHHLLFHPSDENNHVEVEVFKDIIGRGAFGIVYTVSATLLFANGKFQHKESSKSKVIKMQVTETDVKKFREEITSSTYASSGLFVRLAMNLKLLNGLIEDEAKLAVLENEQETKASVHHEYHILRQMPKFNPSAPIIVDFQNRVVTFLMMDKLPGENLLHSLRNNSFFKSSSNYTKFDFVKIIKVCLESAIALQNQVHQRGLVHRDVKENNMLIHIPDCQISYVDFESARLRYEACKNYERCGALAYRAPESYVKRCEVIPEKIDIFSLGRAHSFMLGTQVPAKEELQTDEAQLAYACNRKLEKIFSNVIGMKDDEKLRIRALLSIMLDPDPKLRPPLEHVIDVYEEILFKHDFIKDYKLSRDLIYVHREAIKIRKEIEACNRTRIRFISFKVLDGLKDKIITLIETIPENPNERALVEEVWRTLRFKLLQGCQTKHEIKHKVISLFTRHQYLVSELMLHLGSTDIPLIDIVRKALAKRNKFTFTLDNLHTLNELLNEGLKQINQYLSANYNHAANRVRYSQ